MGTFIGTSTVASGVTHYEFFNADLGYIVIILMILTAVLLIDLVRRIFIRK